jgi:hypothetical protein
MNTEVTNAATEVRKEISLGPVTVFRVYKSERQKKNTLTAELRQEIKTLSYYPTQRVDSNISSNIFAIKDFKGIEDKPFESIETRVAWLEVPEDATVESVKAQLAKFPEAQIYKVLSNKPIISDSEQYAINNPELSEVTLDSYANRQIVRYPKGNENEGKIVLVNGKPQYRRTPFFATVMPDQDMRTSEPKDFYASAEILAEMQGFVSIPEGAL